MTTFEPAGDYFDMNTNMLIETFDALKTIGDLEGTDVVESLNRLLSQRSLYDEYRAAGALMVARTANVIDPLTIRQGAQFSGRMEVIALETTVLAQSKEYLETYADPANPNDLLDFWRSAVRYYGDIRERQLLGSDFYLITPDMAMQQVRVLDSFAGSEAAAQKKPGETALREWLKQRREREQ